MTQEVIKLEGVLNIARVEALHAQFEELEKNAAPILLNAADVSRADTSVLQLLVSFFKAMATLEVDVSWQDASEEFKASARLLGLTTELKLN